MGLKLTLLGGFDLRHEDGRTIELAGAKDRALLAFLAARPGTDHPREKAADLLWGEHGEAQARDSLKHALIRLRQALGRRSRRIGGPSGWSPARSRWTWPKPCGSCRRAAARRSNRRHSLCRGEFLEESTPQRSLRRMASGRAPPAAPGAGGNPRPSDRTCDPARRPRHGGRAARRLLQLDALQEGAGRALKQLLHAQGRASRRCVLYEGLRAGFQIESRRAPRRSDHAALRSDPGGRASILVDADGIAVTVPPTPISPTSNPRSRVLPVQNLSDDPGQQFLAMASPTTSFTVVGNFSARCW